MKALWMVMLSVLLAMPAAEARSGWFRRTRTVNVPLMPARTRVASYGTTASDATVTGDPRATIGWGFELGSLGRAATDAKALGVELMPGGRVHSDFTVWESLRARPSLGYFYSRGGEAQVAVTRYTVEGGVSLLWDCYPLSQNTVMVGLAQRVDVVWSQTSIPGSRATSSAMASFYRVGPQVSGMLPIAPAWYLTLNAELTFSPSEAFKTYPGLTVGITTWSF